MNWRRVLLEASALVAAAAVAGAGANVFRSEARKLAWVQSGDYEARSQSPSDRPAAAATATGGAAVVVPRDPSQLYAVVSDELVLRLQRAGVLFIDARRSDAYGKGHIPGARSIPVWEHDVDSRIAALKAAGMPYDREIVVYCSGPTCEDSERLAEKLVLAGFFRLSVYKDGFPDWQRRGWPVTEGENP